MLFLTLEYVFMSYIFSLMINNITILKSFGFSEKSNFASLIIFMKFYEVLIFTTGKLQATFNRKMEFKADAYAANEFEFLGEQIRHGLKHFFIKVFKKNSANLNPDWLYVAWNQSHPLLYERIIALPDSKCKSKCDF
jgi:Zn-dependent protease with chaperone function